MTRPALRRAAIVLVSALALAGRATAQRLPHDVVPLHYQLTLAPDFGTSSFDGDVTIDLRIDTPTDRITLNAVDLEINHSELTLPTGRIVRPEVSSDRRAETVTFALPTRLPGGTAKLRIEYSGRLGSDLRGFYAGRANGRRFAATQFESTDARRAFPCFDEPAFKASFTISAVVEEHDTAISNGWLISDTPGPRAGRHTLRFSTTPKMSSYLAALVVGDFQCLEGSADPVPIRVCAVRDRKDLGQFALDAAEHILRFYEQYFTFRYPFRKLDLVAVPDFPGGAMENTGAIFFNEHDLLLDRPAAPPEELGRVAAVISHEIAHQWLGDVVTMRWWDDLWLNEGLATWMESKPVAAWMPAWHADQASARDSDDEMDLDALGSTRAVRSPMTTPAEIEESFDDIVYNKAGAVLRMVEDYVGSETFRIGLNAYIKAHAYDNASAEDFWSEMAKASERPVDRLLPTFLDQPGLPLVTIDSRCEGTDRTVVTLTQRRFTIEPPGQSSDQLWQIPIALRAIDGSGKTGESTALLSGSQQAVPLDGCAPLVFANGGGNGYFRSVYAPETLLRLARAAHERLAPAERVRLVGDEWALVRAGVHGIGDYLALVEALASDTAPAVIEQAARGLSFTRDYLVTERARGQFEVWVRKVFGPVAASLGWTVRPADGEETKRLRAAVLGIMGEEGHDPDALAAARAMLVARLDGTATIDASLVPTATRLAMVTADADLAARLLGAVKAWPSQERRATLVAMAASAGPSLVSRVLDRALSDEVGSEDAAALVAAALHHGAGSVAAWGHLKAHWNDIQRRAGPSALPLLVGAASSLCDAGARDDVQRFFGEKSPSTGRALHQTLERIDACRDVRLREQGKLEAWLAAR